MLEFSVMDIIDGHLDLAYNALELKRNITLPLAIIRKLESAAPQHNDGTAAVCLPAIRTAGIDIVFATIFVPPYYSETNDSIYRSPQETDYAARSQLDYYHELHAAGEITLIHNLRDLQTVMQGISPKPGVIITLEGAEALLTPTHLNEYYQRGVRILGPAWRTTRYAPGSESAGEFTVIGRELLVKMANLGVVLDISHLADEACWQALQIFPGRVVATHTACRKLVSLPRLLPDEIIIALAERDGIIGLACYNRFLQTPNEDNLPPTLNYMMNHFAHIIKLTGSTRHLAIGSDLDGGFGSEKIPQELDSIADLPAIGNQLITEGYSPCNVSAIMQDNWLRLLKEVLPA